MGKIALPTEARQSQAVLGETRRLIAESCAEAGFMPRLLRPRMERSAA